MFEMISRVVLILFCSVTITTLWWSIHIPIFFPIIFVLENSNFVKRLVKNLFIYLPFLYWFLYELLASISAHGFAALLIIVWVFAYCSFLTCCQLLFLSLTRFRGSCHSVQSHNMKHAQNLHTLLHKWWTIFLYRFCTGILFFLFQERNGCKIKRNFLLFGFWLTVDSVYNTMIIKMTLVDTSFLVQRGCY